MSSPPTNSLLNLLNPYASVTASQVPQRDRERKDRGREREQRRSSRSSRNSWGVDDGPGGRESPSAVLLRELQFESGGSASASASAAAAAAPAMARVRSQSQNTSPKSPTPKATPAQTPGISTSASVSASASAAQGKRFGGSSAGPVRPSNLMGDSSSEDDVPASVMFDGGRSTPTRPSAGAGAAAGLAAPGTAERWASSRSPGPFRRQPSSTSSSTQSPTSPTIPLHGLATHIPDVGPAGPASTSTKSDHSPRSTSTEDLPTARPSARPWAVVHEPEEHELHATPLVSPPSGRTRRHGSRKYHALAPAEVNRSDRDRDRGRRKKNGLSGYDKALWQWVNVFNVDSCLQEVYKYYLGKGIWCIALDRVLTVLRYVFVVVFTIFLTSCIDYRKLWKSVGNNHVGRLEDVLVGQCFSRRPFGLKLMLIIVSAYFGCKTLVHILNIPALIDMYRFYTYLLGVPDTDIQTMPWPEVVRLIAEIKQHHPIMSQRNQPVDDFIGDAAANDPSLRLDAHDIANRIMRKENYLIALFNEDLLDLRVRVPVPKALERFFPASWVKSAPNSGLPHAGPFTDQKFLTLGDNTLTYALESNLRYCLLAYFFDVHGQVRRDVVRGGNRADLVKKLQFRFYFYGLLNAIFAPFIVIMILLYSFYRYFQLYHKDPSSMGSRAYTLYARWRFREFNELEHLFDRRLRMSYPAAKDYVDQYPKERTSLIMRFVSFIAGAFAAVLLLATLYDPDLFLNFEITPHRTVFFYLGIFGTVLTVSRSMTPDQNAVVDPESLMREIVQYTHYLPPEWKGKLHSQKVLQDFGHLFQLKVTIFFVELLSVLTTPLILFFSLPHCAGAIVDFFHQSTVHVDSLGYVCSHAVFDFHRPGALGPEGAAAEAPEILTGAPPSAPAGVRQRNGRARLQPPAIYNPAPSVHADDDLGAYYDNKMQQSVMNFMETHPHWQPSDPSQSLFLENKLRDRPPAPHARDKRGRPVPLRVHSDGAHGAITSPRPVGLGLGLGLGPAPALSLHENRNAGPGARWFQPADLATMDERDADADADADEDADRAAASAEANALGWNTRGGDPARSASDDADPPAREDRGLLRDAGILLNQVMNR